MNEAMVMDLTNFSGNSDNAPRKAVKIGDWVGFKCDIEQGGKIIEIKRGWNGAAVLVLESKGGFHGEYIGGQTRTEENASDCWIS